MAAAREKYEEIDDAGGLFHERQRGRMCGAHALNNLFGSHWVDGAALDGYANVLPAPEWRWSQPSTWFNQYKSVWGDGDYGIEVLIQALSSKDYQAQYHGPEVPVGGIDLDAVPGLILNTRRTDGLGGLLARSPFASLREFSRHWYCVRRRVNGENDGDFYEFDSKKPAPVHIGGNDQTMRYLQDLQSNPNNNLTILKVPKRFQGWPNSEAERQRELELQRLQ